MSSSHTQRTLRWCEKKLWLAGVVEKWLPNRQEACPICQATTGKGGVRKDLFGFIDLVAIDGAQGVVAIQVCATSSMASRLNKIRTVCSKEATTWLAFGNRIQIHGWSKKHYKLTDGSKSKVERWSLRRVKVFLLEGSLEATALDDES